MHDTFECEDHEEFYDKQYEDYSPIHTVNQPDPPQDGWDVRQLTELNVSTENEIVARVQKSEIREVKADALICGITTDPSLNGGVATDRSSRHRVYRRNTQSSRLRSRNERYARSGASRSH